MPPSSALAHSNPGSETCARTAGIDSVPRMVIFSGGTAFNPTARQLKQLTPDTLHVVPGFDSGGSSAKLRHALAMPAVGDMRSRLMALADESDPVSNAIRKIMSRRLRSQPQPARLHRRMASKVRDLIQRHQSLLSSTQSQHLLRLLQHFPQEHEIDLDRASIGNLALVSAYLWHERDLDAASHTIGQLIGAHGQVMCSANEDVHLACRLADGSVILGQHRITGKETPPLTQAITDSWLCASTDDPSPVRCRLRPQLRNHLQQTDLIVLAPGSFHSSVACHLLVDGMPQALAQRSSPLVYVPNLGHDPELVACESECALRLLLHRLCPTLEVPGGKPRMDFILVDNSRRNDYAAMDLEALGIRLIHTDLLDPDNPQRHCPHKLAGALLDLARRQDQLAY